MNTLTFGISSREKFCIGFDYYVHGKLYSDEFQCPVAIAQEERITIAYNPLQPEENSRSSRQARTGLQPLIAVGIAGSVMLSILWLLLLRGCR